MDAVLVRYGELFLKSEPVKRRYIDILLRNIRRALDAEGCDYRIEVYRGRILIEGDNLPGICASVRRVFGVVGVSPCIRTPPVIEAIMAAAVQRALSRLKPGMSYAVRARRAGLAGFTSQELGKWIGSEIYAGMDGLEVDLGHPDYEIFVEARDIGGLVYDERLKGPGGLPLGTQGPVLSLLSPGIDSPVASWLMMRRGCDVTHLSFDGGSWMGEDVTGGTFENHRRLSAWCPGQPLTLMVVSLGPFFDRLVGGKNPRYRCIICKRFMLRVAGRIARDQGLLALVTGDSLGQVASQTLANMGVIEEAATPEIPVLRPLITFDKQESVELARTIGTFRDAAGDLGCIVVPKHPALAATLEAVRSEEGKLGIEALVEEALSSVRGYRALNGEMEEIR
ncbi:MAG: tRNA 4-thiouridine(8) synthase ThiI [Methanomicrobiaceae archaeon]|nr:tRNA 4-thiouridine(8) synthase ThiI [Methanomicrobiaceae archaeon]